MAEPFAQWFKAVRSRDHELVRDLIGQCACQRDLHGQTALMIAATADDELMVNMLLPHEACSVDPQGRTALMLAAIASCPGSAQLLAEKEGRMLAPDGRNAMMLAASYGAHSVVLALLPFFNYETDKSGYTALDHAAIGGHLETVKILVQHLDFSVESLSKAREHAYRNVFTAVADYISLAIEERIGVKNSTVTMTPGRVASQQTSMRATPSGYRSKMVRSAQMSDPFQFCPKEPQHEDSFSYSYKDISYTQSLQSLVRDHEDQILRQNKIIDQLTSKIAEQDKEIVYWQSAQANLAEEAAQTQQAESQEDRDPMNDINVLKATINVKSTNLERLQRKFDDEVFQHQLLRAEHAELQEAHERLTGKAENLRAELFNRDTSGINMGNVLYLQEAITELEKELADARLIITNMMDDNNYLADVSALQRDGASLPEILSLEVKVLKHKYMQQHIKHGDAMQKLRTTCEHLHGKINEQERQLRKERQALKQEKQTKEKSMLLDVIDEQTAKIKKLQTSLSIAKHNPSPGLGSYSEAKEIDRLESEIALLKANIANKDDQIYTILKQLEAKNDLKIVTEVYDIDKNQQDEITIGKLRQELNAARATIAQLRATAHKEQSIEPCGYEPEMATSRSTSQISTKRRTQQETRSTPTKSSSRSSRSMSSLLAEKDRMISSLQKEVSQQKKKLASEQQATYEQVAEIAKKLAEATAIPRDTIQLSHTDFADLKNLIYSLQQKLSTKEAEIETLKSANRKLVDSLSRERSATLSRINTKVSSLERDSKDLQNEISFAHNQVKDCTSEMQHTNDPPSYLKPEYILSPPSMTDSRGRESTVRSSGYLHDSSRQHISRLASPDSQDTYRQSFATNSMYAQPSRQEPALSGIRTKVDVLGSLHDTHGSATPMGQQTPTPHSYSSPRSMLESVQVSHN